MRFEQSDWHLWWVWPDFCGHAPDSCHLHFNGKERSSDFNFVSVFHEQQHILSCTLDQEKETLCFYTQMWQKWLLLFLSTTCRDSRDLYCLQVWGAAASPDVTHFPLKPHPVPRRHSAALSSWQSCTTNAIVLNEAQYLFRVQIEQKETLRASDRVSARWCAQAEANSTFRSLIFLCEALASGHRQRDIQNASDHHAELFFSPFLSVMAVASEQSRPQKFPSSAQTPGTEEITLYQLSHKLTVKVWRRQCTSALVWYPRPRIPQTLQLSPRLEPSCASNKWDTFHSDLRQRNTSHLVCTYKAPVS